MQFALPHRLGRERGQHFMPERADDGQAIPGFSNSGVRIGS